MQAHQRRSRAPLPRSFYLRPTLRVARGLLGCLLVRRDGRTTLSGRIVEVEAYLGSRDPASHAWHGRTARNDVMFRGGGHLYVYFTYGMHFCANVVTGPVGSGHAVLIRALEPLGGIAAMRRNRGRIGRGTDDLTNGPARLCQALALGGGENGTDLCNGKIYLTRGTGRVKPGSIASSTRVGIRRGVHHRWRFYLRDNPFVSPARPARPEAADRRD